MIDLGDVPDSFLIADIVIVGAGVIGCSMAETFLGTGHRVLVLEAGDTHPSGVSDETIPAASESGPLEGLTRGRRRGYGGTGARWAGQCAPLDAIDLEYRPWIAGASWPVAADELALWYDTAARSLRIADEPFDERQWLRHRISPLSDNELTHKFSIFSPKPNVGERIKRRLERSSNVHVLTNATVTEVLLTEDHSHVSGVEVAQRGGHLRHAFGHRVVIAAGGIESARLLLLSRTQQQEGIGNAFKLVGRYLHDHPNCYAADVDTSDSRRFQDLYGMLYNGGTRAWARMPLPRARQIRLQSLNATANAVFIHREDSPVAHLKSLVRDRHGLSRADVSDLSIRAIKALPAVPSVAWRRYARGLSPSAPARSILLQAMSEQQPMGSSRVSLSNQVDALGRQVAAVRWVLDESERRSQLAVVSVIKDAWERAGLAKVTLRPYMHDADDWAEQQSDAYHHSGTTRMASNVRMGVVDKNLQVYGVPGLFVAGTAVLPTSSHSNPTFPALALALRLTARLKASIEKGS